MRGFLVLIGLLAATSASGAGSSTSTVIIIGDGSCDPVVKHVGRGAKLDEAVSKRLAALYQQDQKARDTNNIDWAKLNAEDRRRRLEVNGLLEKKLLFSGQDFFHAAMIFQHGSCPAHFRLAQRLAQVALNLGVEEAKWLYAATTDRFLRSTGKPQKYGTQYICTNGAAALQPYDASTTDAQRARYHVPTLKAALARASTLPCP